MKENIPARWWRNKNFARPTTSNSWRTLPRAMEPDDVRRLLRKRFTSRDKCMILMLLRSGMRISELLAVKLQDINLSGRAVTIRESAKTGIGRITYLSDDVYKALRKWMKARKANTKFLLYSRGEMNMSYSTARSSFTTCLRKAHLVRKGYTLHSLRHYAESMVMPSSLCASANPWPCSVLYSA